MISLVAVWRPVLVHDTMAARARLVDTVRGAEAGTGSEIMPSTTSLQTIQLSL
jgi:hypothetical protein